MEVSLGLCSVHLVNMKTVKKQQNPWKVLNCSCSLSMNVERVSFRNCTVPWVCNVDSNDFLHQMHFNSALPASNSMHGVFKDWTHQFEPLQTSVPRKLYSHLILKKYWWPISEHVWTCDDKFKSTETVNCAIILLEMNVVISCSSRWEIASERWSTYNSMFIFRDNHTSQLTVQCVDNPTSKQTEVDVDQRTNGHLSAMCLIQRALEKRTNIWLCTKSQSQRITFQICNEIHCKLPCRHHDFKKLHSVRVNVGFLSIDSLLSVRGCPLWSMSSVGESRWTFTSIKENPHTHTVTTCDVSL